jgi:L-alanine-DL-glutamate epimerase-like enolase superfamily enzyme
MNVRIEVFRAALHEEFTAAWGSVSARELVLLTVQENGIQGHGEGAPLPGYDGAGVDDVLAGLEACRPVLEAGGEPDRLRARCAELTVVPQALSAIDLALWDLAGRRAGVPVWRLIGAGEAMAVPVNYTIGSSDRAGAAREAAAAREAGFSCVKLKVGIGDDAGRVAAVRAAAGAEMAIRLDANGAWSVPEAQATLRVLAPARLELCEEPVHGLAETAELAGSCEVALAIDETTTEPGALDRRVCQAACLKLARCGGISGLLAAAHTARAASYEVYLASTLDGPLGIAAALHAAAVIQPDRPCGLATLGMFERPATELQLRSGALPPPPGPGLGDGLGAWYR